MATKKPNVELNGKWAGRGAEIQGLAGKVVTYNKFIEQLKGIVKNYDEVSKRFVKKQLGRTTTKKVKHRFGWELVLAPPKTVSIEAEIWGKEDVFLVHQQAVADAMRFLEDVAGQTRKSGDRVKTGNLTYAVFHHISSREHDPLTHTHVFIINVTYLDKKLAYSLSNELLLDYRMSADAVYMNSLSRGLVRLGYRLVWNDHFSATEIKVRSFEIEGYTREQIEYFSKRRGQIKKALAKRGKDETTGTFFERRYATLKTRSDKTPAISPAHPNQEGYFAPVITKG